MAYNVGYPSAEQMAKWPKPSANPPYNGWLVPAVEIPFAVVAFFMGFIRFYFRHRSNTIGMDDWLMLAVVPFGILMLVSTIMGVHYGAGHHIWDMKPEWIPTFQKLLLIFETSSIWAHAFCRLSLLFLYRRLFTDVRSYKFYVNVGIWFNLIVLAGGFTGYMVQCVPIQAYWNWDQKPRHCTNSMAVLVTINVLNCLGYFYVFFLPLVPVSRANLPPMKKFAVVSLFAVGFITCAVSTVKVAVSIVLFVRGDPTWVVSSLFILCNVEKSLTMICASIPACFKLVKASNMTGKGKRSPNQTASTLSANSQGEQGTEQRQRDSLLARIAIWKQRAQDRANAQNPDLSRTLVSEDGEAVDIRRAQAEADGEKKQAQRISVEHRENTERQSWFSRSRFSRSFTRSFNRSANRQSFGADLERGMSLEIGPATPRVSNCPPGNVKS